MEKNLIEQLDEIQGVPCPCGISRRATFIRDKSIASIHLVDVSQNTRAHYHKKMTEVYLVLEGEGFVEIDGTKHPVKPMSTVLIEPGTRHRAMGNMKIINVPFPAFDERDEFFDNDADVVNGRINKINSMTPKST